jgi:transglutaminase-like putative cysteine protease
MKHLGVLSLELVVFLTAVVRTEPASELVEEIWEVAYIDGAKVGYLHTTVRSKEIDGMKQLRANAELELTFKRNNAVMKLHMEQGTEETAEGKVTGVFMKQESGKGQPLVLHGTVEGERLHVVVDSGRIDSKVRWTDQAVGLYQWLHLFEQKKPKVGETFTFPRYEPIINHVVTMRVRVKEEEEVQLLGKKQSLLRVEMTPDKIEVPGQVVQLPGVVWWLDGDFVPQRRQFELEGLGTVVLTRTTREVATAAAPPAKLPDVGLKTLIPLNRVIPKPYDSRAAVYRVTIRGDSEAATALASDAHQQVKNAKGETFELHVHPARHGEGRTSADAAAAEYLASCPFINCDDKGVKDLARKAAGNETDAWKKAVRLEKWVHTNMRVDQSAPMVSAAQAARELTGDCRNHALLLAALCRAEGVPSRIAVGLLCVDKAKQPQMGFHMWTEVYIDGQWLGLDAILGKGGVAASHIKIADHSWRDVQSLTPFLPVARVLGKTAIEVVSVEGE